MKLACCIASALVLFVLGGIAWAAEPAGVVAVKLPIDVAPYTTQSLRLVPGDQRILRFTLYNGTSALSLGDYTTYTLYLLNASGTALSSKTLTKESPVASGKVACVLSAGTVTSLVKYVSIKMKVQTTSGTVQAVAGPMSATVPSVAAW